ncbi:FMN-dependent NADH-azoreductase [Oculatella sp. FACHB-28]|uniref:FMN-dependent NADH-azoreductase n=1 Tax=Cyanophyceae TaxID=3028117 RepID=UPI001687F425|nr:MULTISPECIES: FMN-dependent NADH-azoreductase [Cyanophyceae]MBD1998158.1 FMN-dependent NADH-azoreductase [Leptolyngbya sp. FACHB-541]MBD2060193.1 FMN-dependent NADH-azoreductase [Oculatella sp. FACHB-28]
MAHILHIDVSPRGDRSISRTLSKEFVNDWKATHPDDTVTYRDLGHNPVPLVTEPWIAAAYSSPEQHTPEQAEAIRISDELVDEFLAADRFVFALPMYNFSISASFKAYIDQIVRVGRTFAVDENGYKGLVHGKKALVVAAQGGSYPEGSPAHSYDMQTPYLQLILGFMGITDLQFIHADNLMGGEEGRKQAIANAQSALKAAVSNW